MGSDVSASRFYGVYLSKYVFRILFNSTRDAVLRFLREYLSKQQTGLVSTQLTRYLSEINAYLHSPFTSDKRGILLYYFNPVTKIKLDFERPFQYWPKLYSTIVNTISLGNDITLEKKLKFIRSAR